MLIGLQTLMIAGQPLLLASILVLTCRGGQRNSFWLLVPVLRLAQAVAEVLWLQSLLRELKIPLNVPTVLCDNLSTIALAHNPVLHARSKHMELDIFFVREKVLSKNLVVSHVPALHQYADLLTKALSPKRFLLLRSKLNVADPSSMSHPP